MKRSIINSAGSVRPVTFLPIHLSVMMATVVFVMSAAAEPLHHWTWEGTEGFPGSGDATWAHDKISNVHMRNIQDNPARLELPSSGLGSAFPDPLPNPTDGVHDYNQWGLDPSNGWLRTYNDLTFERDRFTLEIFFHATEIRGRNRIFEISRLHPQVYGVVMDGILAVHLFHPEAPSTSSPTIIQSSFGVDVGVDYYTAIAISTGPEPEERFVDFYLMNLSSSEPLQHERVPIVEEFSSLYKDGNGLSLHVGRDRSFSAIGDVRYSDGILSEEELLIHGHK